MRTVEQRLARIEAALDLLQEQANNALRHSYIVESLIERKAQAREDGNEMALRQVMEQYDAYWKTEREENRRYTERLNEVLG